MLGRLRGFNLKAISAGLSCGVPSFGAAALRVLQKSIYISIIAFVSVGCSVEGKLEGLLGAGGKTLVTITSSPLTEGAAGDVTLTLAKALPADVVLTYSSVSGTATDAVDYTSVTGNLTITAGQTVGTINVVTLQDATFEGAETFELNFTIPTTP